jgi:hypothetical protein
MISWILLKFKVCWKTPNQRKSESIAYTNVTDLKQSNIGSEVICRNTGGQTKIVGNTIFVSFDGDHGNLRRQTSGGFLEVSFTN